MEQTQLSGATNDPQLLNIGSYATPGSPHQPIGRPELRIWLYATFLPIVECVSAL